MRLWSIHPKYLDTKGLVALWREGLGAQKALVAYSKNEKCGYQNHPQLDRFKKLRKVNQDVYNKIMMWGISKYLWGVYHEAKDRGYKFNSTKISVINSNFNTDMCVTNGQLRYEFNHLLEKLKTRDYEQYLRIKDIEIIMPHPLFMVVGGDIEDWEKVK